MNHLRQVHSKDNNKKARIVDLWESKLYLEDEDFEFEEEKQEYYFGELWIDSDFLICKGERIPILEVGGEIIISSDISDFLEIDLTIEQLKLIEVFYSEPFAEYRDKYNFKELSTWSRDIENSYNELMKCNLGIQYRGGIGYAYGWWILKP